MKTTRKIILFLFTLLAISRTYCQKVEVLGAETCCLYTDVSNPLKVVVNGKVLKANEYTVELNTGTFLKTDTCLWIKDITAYNIIVTIKSKSGKLIAKKSFNKINPPEPAIIADGKYGGGNTEKQELVNISGFVPFLFNFPYPLQYKISKYQASITLGNETRTFFCEGATLSDTVRYYLSRMKPYDKAVFSHFYLNNFRHQYSPLIFGISDLYTMLYDYENLFYDFKGRTYDDNGKIVTWETVKSIAIKPQYYDTLPAIVETNCDYNTDNCTTKVFHRINGKEELTYQYEFAGNDSVRAKWYFNDVLIADIGYCKNSLSGMFSIYYENGQKRVDGFYALGKIFNDTVMRINAVTLNNEQECLPHIIPYQQGEWMYYNTKGEKIYARRFKDGEIW